MKTKPPKIFVPCYDPLTHTYHDEAGNRLEGTTDILTGELGGYDGYPEATATRGTHVHDAIQYHNEGDLDESTLTDEVAGYLECFKRAKAHHGIKVIQNEVMRYHPVYRYAGRCDAIVEIDGKVGILDYKTGAPMRDHKWQVAAYLELLKAEVPNLKGRWDLYLKPGQYEGGLGFKLVEHTGPRDFLEFLTLFGAYQIKKNEKYIKEKRRT